MSRIQPKTQRSIIAHKSTCAPPCSIPRTGYTKKHSSISWSVSGDTRGNLPRAKKQSTGLFFVRCGAPPCSIPRTGYTKKHSSISWSVFGDTRGNLPRAKKQSTGLFFVRCGAPPCSIPHTGYTKKAPQHELECFFGDPCGNRTHVNGVRGRCLNRLTNGP